MKRPLVIMAEGFVLGEVWLLLPGMWKMGALTTFVVWGFFVWKREGSSPGYGRLLSLFGLFVLLGAWTLRMDQAEQARLERATENFSGQAVRAEGRVTDVGKTASGLFSLELSRVILYAEEEACPYGDVLVYLDPEEASFLEIGMEVSVRGELEAFAAARNPGQFDYKSYYHSLGISGRIFGKKLEVRKEDGHRYREIIRKIRNRAEDTLVRICRPEDLGLFQAITLGDKTQLSDEIRRLYQDNGIAHLLAVSGLHISFLGMGFYGLLRKLRFPRRPGLLLAVIMTVSYGILTGESASVVRAVLMMCFRFGAERFGRTYDALSAMAFAALWLLVSSPTLLFQAGFQLSFGAVLSLAGLCPFLERMVKGEEDSKEGEVSGKEGAFKERSGFRKKVETTVFASLSIHVVTCPMVIWHFFTFPLYGPILNLVVIPLMGYVLMSGVFGILIGMPGGIFLQAGEFVLGTGHYILEFYQWLCIQVQKLPGAVLFVGRPGLWQIVVYGGIWIVAFGWLYLKRESSVRKKWTVLMAALLGSFWILRPLPVEGLFVTFLDVGQGDGICLETEETAILVDGGSTDEKDLGEQVLEPFLKSRGIREIDYAFVSHGDQDHISGLSWLLEESPLIRIRHLILPWLGQGDEAYEKLCRLAAERNTEIHWMREGDHLQVGALRIRCLYGGEEDKGDERNGHSLLLEVRYGKAGILLTGDMSEGGEKEWLRSCMEQEEVLPEGPIQLIKTAHHGSASSTSLEFLEVVRPRWAVISCGKENSYGHPSPETLKRLEAWDVAYVCTPDSGAVTALTDGTELRIRTYLDP